MTVACIVQARLGSTRLPGKVLLPLPTGRTVLEEVLFRCKRIPGVDVVALATPSGPSAAVLCHLMTGHADICIGHDGPENDVLSRYARATEILGADIVMRITSDCPLIDPPTCGAVLNLLRVQDADYASNVWPARSFPTGWDCQVFTRQTLDRAHREIPAWLNDEVPAWAAVEREHAGCQWMHRQDGIAIANLKATEDRSHLRWTLDTAEDYIRIRAIFQEQMREAA